MVYVERTYRESSLAKGLVSFGVKVEETDLFISADKELKVEAQKAIRKYRSQITSYIDQDKNFASAFSPYSVAEDAPPIIQEMSRAAAGAGVGPMATVAGAMAEFVGQELLSLTKELIIENGGDIFIKTEKPRKVSIFAGPSSLSNKVALEINPEETPLGICTSAGTVGPSFSFGSADAVTVVARSAPLADAAATAIGNAILSKDDISKGLEKAKSIPRIMGVVIIKDDGMGVWGNLKVVKA